MKRIIVSFFSFFVFVFPLLSYSGTSITSQAFYLQPHLYFSNEIPVAGVAKEGKEFFINPAGGYAYFVIDNYPTNFSYDQVRIKVYKNSESYDDATYNISTTSYFTYIKYSFYSAANYSFYAYDKYGNALGSADVMINIQSSTTSTSNNDCASGYQQYYSSAMGFSMCIPAGSYATESNNQYNDITINDFYGDKLAISFIQEPQQGLDKLDNDFIALSRDRLKSTYSSYYRKEFKLVSSKTDMSIYRSVITAVSINGVTYEGSVYYVRMYGKKIKGYDYMVLILPIVDPAIDLSDQIIVEFGMLEKLKIY